MKSFAVQRIRDRIGVPKALSDADFVLDVVFEGVLIPDEIKSRLREDERKILYDIYCGNKIPVEKLQGIEQLTLFGKQSTILHYAG